jgi:hypothetical protein
MGNILLYNHRDETQQKYTISNERTEKLQAGFKVITHPLDLA